MLTVIGLVLWIALSLALLVGLFLAVPAFRRINRVLNRLDRVLERADREMDPTLEHLRRAADNADYITSAVRTDVEAVGDTVERAAESTRRMLEMAEERAVEINGFLEVVQEEAEETFLSTASLLRALRGGGRGGSRRGRKRA